MLFNTWIANGLTRSRLGNYNSGQEIGPYKTKATLHVSSNLLCSLTFL